MFGRILIAYGHDQLHYLESSEATGRHALVATEPLSDDAWQSFATRELRVLSRRRAGGRQPCARLA